MTLDEIQNAVIQGKPRLAEKLVEEALENGADSAEILARGLLGGMQQIGLRFGDDRDVARALASSGKSADRHSRRGSARCGKKHRQHYSALRGI